MVYCVKFWLYLQLIQQYFAPVIKTLIMGHAWYIKVDDAGPSLVYNVQCGCQCFLKL